MAAERAEAVLESLTYTRGVLGASVCLADGTPLRDSFQHLDRSVAIAYCQMASELARTAAALFAGDLAKAAEGTPGLAASAKGKDSAAQPLLQQGSLELMRVRTLNNEVIVRCCQEFLIVVVQEPVDQ